MRKSFLALLFLIFASTVHAQSTTVSGTVQDASGQTWNNGTFQFTFVPNPQYPSGPYTWTGGTLPKNVTGTLNSSGAYSVSVPTNSAISPIGTKWTVQVCSQASSPCYTVANLTVTGTTQTIDVTPPAIAIDLINPPSAPVLAYSDSEIVSAKIGSFYYNLPGETFRVCQVVSGQTCTTWANLGGGTPTGFPRLDQVTDPNQNKPFDLGGTTLSYSNGNLDLSGLTGFLLPSVPGCVASATEGLCVDNLNNNVAIWNGTEAGLIAFLDSGTTYTDGDLLGISVSSGHYKLTDVPVNSTGGDTTIVEAQFTTLVDGETVCWNATLSLFVNCPPGVPVNVQTGTTYTFDGVADRGTAIYASNASAKTYTLPQISEAGDFDGDWFVFLTSIGAGSTTVNTTTSTFASTGTSSFTLSRGQQCSFITDPTGNGTIYPKCHEPLMTATSPIVFTRSDYGLAVSCPTCGTGSGNLSGALTAGIVPVASGATTLVNGSILDDLSHAARNDFGYDVNSLGRYQWWALNNTTTGTTASKMACDDGAGKAIICPAASSTTDDPLGVAVAANGATPGTSGSTGICIIGFCSVIFDNSATAGHYAQVSSSVNGDLTDVGTPKPTNGQDYYYIVAGNSGAGTAATIRNLTPSELNASSISGGNGRNFQVKVNGTATTKTIKDFNGTTPAADANNQLLVWKTSSAANTDSISVEVPLATTGQAGIVQLAGDLGGTSSAPTIAAQYKKPRCETGLGDGLNAMPAGTYLQFFCVNTSGVTWTITGINCWTDNAGTSTLNATNNAGTGLLTGAVTCNNTKSGGGAAGTQSGTTTLANNDAISFTFVADGTSKQTTWTVSLTQ